MDSNKRFLEWEVAAFFEDLWRAGLAEYGQMDSIAARATPSRRATEVPDCPADSTETLHLAPGGEPGSC